ncbi:MAG: nucleotidyltransferase domain-containing protein [Planctomycetota bacterium]
MISMRDIQAFAKRVVEEFHPQRIILFGSYSRGEATPDSDVDMLVIMPFRGKEYLQAAKIRLRVHTPFPMDMLCCRPTTLRKRLAMGDPFLREIVEHGRLLYEGNHG